MLEIITFTGVDATTSLPAVLSLHQRFPKAEFGVLIGSNTHSTVDSGIFPSLHVVRRFRDFSQARGINTALHLCGNWSRGSHA